MKNGKLIIRATYCQPDGVGYLGTYRYSSSKYCVTRDPKDALLVESHGEAWDHIINSGMYGSDEKGEWLWVEEYDPEIHRYIEREETHQEKLS